MVEVAEIREAHTRLIIKIWKPTPLLFHGFQQTDNYVGQYFPRSTKKPDLVTPRTLRPQQVVAAHGLSASVQTGR